MENKEAAGAGVFFAVLIGLLVLMLIFGWGPITFLTDKWNGYWDGLKQSSTQQDIPAASPEIQKEVQARNDNANTAAKAYCKKMGYDDAAVPSVTWGDAGTTTPMNVYCFYDIPNPNK